MRSGGYAARAAADTHATVWRSDSMAGVEITVGVNTGRRCRMLHEAYALCLVPYSGNADVVLSRWRYRGRDYVYRAGSIGIEEPGEVHMSTRVYSPIRYCMLRVAPEVMEAAAVELGLGRVRFPETLISRPSLYDAFSRFYESAASDVASLLERQVRLARLLRLVLTEASVPARDDAPRTTRRSIERARDYLEAHLADPVGLDELSRVAGLSRFHLSRVFTSTYGLSPHAYQNQLRLRTIREWLRRGTPLETIEAGFFDQSHLIRHFRDSIGMTPGTFASPGTRLPPLDYPSAPAFRTARAEA